MTPDEQRHPDAERLAEYADGVLGGEARAELELHLVDCADCRTVVAETMSFVDANPSAAVAAAAPAGASAPRVIPFRSRRWVTGLAVGLAAAAALVLAVRVARPDLVARFLGQGRDERIAKLVAALGEERYIDGRLAGGFKYGALHSVKRGSDLSSQNLQLLAAAGELQKAAQTTPTTENVHAWGVAQLLLGRYDDALASLEESGSERPSDALIQADLAAAYLARAQSQDRPDDLPRALAAADRAIRADATLPEPYFTRAAALESLHLLRQAVVAWEEYLKLDRGSDWRAEAAKRAAHLQSLPKAKDDQGALLKELSDPGAIKWRDAARSLGQRYPRAAREWVEDFALGGWANAELRHSDDEAGIWLERARFVAGILEPRSSDRSLNGLVRVLDAATGAKRADLVKAHAAFSEGRKLYADFNIAKARTRFEESVAHASSSAALSLSSELSLSITRYYEHDLDGAARSLEEVASAAHAKQFRSYEARCYWMLGIIEGVQGNYSGSLGQYEEALKIYQLLGEEDNVAAMRNLLADGLSTLGRPREAWAYLQPALEHWTADWNPRRQYGALMTASVLARRNGMPEAVANFQDAVIEIATVLGTKPLLFQAYLERARADVQLEQFDDARRVLTLARALLGQITDRSQQVTLEGQILRVDSLVESPSNPARAVKNLEQAAKLYGDSGSSLQLLEIELAAVRALRTSGQMAQAKRTAALGLDRIDSQREAISQSELRVTFLDRVWDLYLEAIQLALDEGASDEAFSLAERGRARTFVDARQRYAPFSIHDVQRKLQKGDALVYFVAQTRVWSAWVVTPGAVRLTTGDIDPIVRANRNLDRALVGLRPGEVDRALGELSALVLRPLESELGGTTHVVVCPDGPFTKVPFSALRTRDGRYLVERASVALVPAARALMEVSVRADRKVAATILAPTIGNATLRGLPSLPAAAGEAAAIATLYGVDPVSGADATRDAFLAALGRSDVLHFAGHTIVNMQSPETSFVVLAAANGGEGGDLLTAQDIGRAEVKSGATIVLASCSSAAPSARRGEGALNLARPFLARGAGSVVATLWDVADNSVSQVFTEFHRGLREGLDPDDALARAQRLAIRDEQLRTQFGWASVVVTDARPRQPQ